MKGHRNGTLGFVSDAFFPPVKFSVGERFEYEKTYIASGLCVREKSMSSVLLHTNSWYLCLLRRPAYLSQAELIHFDL